MVCRPTSRAYTNSLSQRIELLEGMLKQVGQTPPPACHPPRTTRSFPQQGDNADESIKTAPKAPRVPQPDSMSSSQSVESGDEISQPIDQVPELPELPENDLYHTEEPLRRPSQTLERSQRSSNSPLSSVGSKDKGIVDRILSTSGHLSYDSASGRLRYFGPTTNFHVYADLNMATTRNESREQTKRTDKIIRALPPEVYDYLMELYWSSYNSVLHVVHRKAFEEDKENGGTQNYSGFLNICLLAMGYRFADPNRPETQKIGVWDRESDLHREAKYLFEYELEKPGGIPSVQALLILGDLECGVGRDNTGWMIGGMSLRPYLQNTSCLCPIFDSSIVPNLADDTFRDGVSPRIRPWSESRHNTTGSHRTRSPNPAHGSLGMRSVRQVSLDCLIWT